MLARPNIQVQNLHLKLFGIVFFQIRKWLTILKDILNLVPVMFLQVSI